MVIVTDCEFNNFADFLVVSVGQIPIHFLSEIVFILFLIVQNTIIIDIGQLVTMFEIKFMSFNQFNQEITYIVCIFKDQYFLYLQKGNLFSIQECQQFSTDELLDVHFMRTLSFRFGPVLLKKYKFIKIFPDWRLMLLEQEIFPIPSSSLPKESQNIKIEACCQIFIRKAVPSQSEEIDFQDQKYENHRIILSIAGEYVYQINAFLNKPKSGFKCDFDIKFWMIRTPSIVTFVQQQIASAVGKIKGITFQFPSQPLKQTVSLFLDEQCTEDQVKSLQNFAFVLERKYIVQRQFHQKYKAIKRIGKGVTASVYSSLCLIDKSKVAIKSFKKEVYFNQDNGNGKKGFLKEFKILTELNYKYLSKLIGVYESDHSIYIVQELLDRTLHSYLQKFGFPDTVQTRKLLYQLLMGLRYLHQKNIMHRDIKLENILIRGISKDNITPVIVDFGLADYQDSKQFVYIRCGTPGYVAPEVINLNKDEKNSLGYNKSCDIFSMGVIFHILLLGRAVFEGDDMRQVVQQNKICLIDYEFRKYPSLSFEIKDLLTGMLHKNSQKRYSVQQLMNHPFFDQEKIQFAHQLYLNDKEMSQVYKI